MIMQSREAPGAAVAHGHGVSATPEGHPWMGRGPSAAHSKGVRPPPSPALVAVAAVRHPMPGRLLPAELLTGEAARDVTRAVQEATRPVQPAAPVLQEDQVLTDE